MTTINAGLGAGFPAAFLTSVLIRTPTAYVVVPRVLRLTTALGGTPARLPLS